VPSARVGDLVRPPGCLEYPACACTVGHGAAHPLNHFLTQAACVAPTAQATRVARTSMSAVERRLQVRKH
jgi:hypothetical protein